MLRIRGFLGRAITAVCHVHEAWAGAARSRRGRAVPLVAARPWKPFIIPRGVILHMDQTIFIVYVGIVALLTATGALLIHLWEKRMLARLASRPGFSAGGRRMTARGVGAGGPAARAETNEAEDAPLSPPRAVAPSSLATIDTLDDDMIE